MRKVSASFARLRTMCRILQRYLRNMAILRLLTGYLIEMSRQFDLLLRDFIPRQNAAT